MPPSTSTCNEKYFSCLDIRSSNRPKISHLTCTIYSWTMSFSKISGHLCPNFSHVRHFWAHTRTMAKVPDIYVQILVMSDILLGTYQNSGVNEKKKWNVKSTYLRDVGKSSADKTSNEFHPTVETAPNTQDIPKFWYLLWIRGIKKTLTPDKTILVAENKWTKYMYYSVLYIQ